MLIAIIIIVIIIVTIVIVVIDVMLQTIWSKHNLWMVIEPMWVFWQLVFIWFGLCCAKIWHILPLSVMIRFYQLMKIGVIGKKHITKVCYVTFFIFLAGYSNILEELVLQRCHKVGHTLFLHWSWQTLMKIVLQRYILIHYWKIWRIRNKCKDVPSHTYLMLMLIDQAVHICTDADAGANFNQISSTYDPTSPCPKINFTQFMNSKPRS